MHEHTAANDPVSAASAADRLEQVREILFGDRLRDLEAHLAVLENRLREHERLLREELAAGLGQLREQLDGRLAAADGRLGQLDADLKDDVQALRRELGERLDGLAERVAREHAELTRRWQEENALLQAQKVAGTTLAALLEELAGKLRAAEGPGP